MDISDVKLNIWYKEIRYPEYFFLFKGKEYSNNNELLDCYFIGLYEGLRSVIISETAMEFGQQGKVGYNINTGRATRIDNLREKKHFGRRLIREIFEKQLGRLL